MDLSGMPSWYLQRLQPKIAAGNSEEVWILKPDLLTISFFFLVSMNKEGQ